MKLDEISLKIYNDELLPWLPEEIIDIHVHVNLPEHVGEISPERFKQMWAIEVASSQSWDELREAQTVLFPNQKVTSLAFGLPYKEVDVTANNEYVLSGLQDSSNNAFVLMLTKPSYSVESIIEGFAKGFIGIKPYPDLVDGQNSEISIYDMLPKNHLEVINNHKGIVMLHLPRSGRIADANNIREIIEIREKYPNVKLIIAHIGRAFALPTAEKGLPLLADIDGLYFDTSANLNADVFEFAIKTLGIDKILYGSDLPITLMRGIREYDGDKYFNFTDGGYSWNTNRKSKEIESSYTFYLYEEIRALIEAVKRLRLSKNDFSKIMHKNSFQLINK